MARNEAALDEFLSPLEVLPYTSDVSETYGAIRAELERGGRTIGPLDMVIAAHARSLGLVLITNNEKEFRKVPNLTVENWVQSGRRRP